MDGVAPSLPSTIYLLSLHIGYYESEMVMRAGTSRNPTKHRHRKVIMVLAVKTSALKTDTNVLLDVITQCMWGSGKLTSSTQSWTRAYRTGSATNLGGSDCQRSCCRAAENKFQRRGKTRNRIVSEEMVQAYIHMCVLVDDVELVGAPACLDSLLSGFVFLQMYLCC